MVLCRMHYPVLMQAVLFPYSCCTRRLGCSCQHSLCWQVEQNLRMCWQVEQNIEDLKSGNDKKAKKKKARFALQFPCLSL